MDEKLLDDILEENGVDTEEVSDEVTEEVEDVETDINSAKHLLEGEYPDDSIAEIVNGSSSRYVNYSDKYEDAKSTAVALTSFGVIGLGVIGASVAGLLDKVVKLPFDLKDNTLNVITMGGMCLVFTVIGIRYAFKTKEYQQMIGKEKSDYDRINEWLKTSITPDIVPDEGSEEELYFKRCEVIKDKLMREYEDIDENLIDKLIDENYDEIFSK